MKESTAEARQEANTVYAAGVSISAVLFVAMMAMDWRAPFANAVCAVPATLGCTSMLRAYGRLAAAKAIFGFLLVIGLLALRWRHR